MFINMTSHCVEISFFVLLVYPPSLPQRLRLLQATHAQRRLSTRPSNRKLAVPDDLWCDSCRLFPKEVASCLGESPAGGVCDAWDWSGPSFPGVVSPVKDQGTVGFERRKRADPVHMIIIARQEH